MVLLLALSGVTLAGVPPYMNYQGILLDADGDPITTTVSVTFTIYNNPDAGSVRWNETRSVTPDADGRFNIVLGELENLTSAVFTPFEEFWLGIKVGADPEMTPRIRLVTVPYAHRVGTLDSTAGGSILGATSVGGDFSVWGECMIGANVNNGGTGTLVAGTWNNVGIGSAVTGGKENEADLYSFVGGGRGNTAVGDTSVVAGGLQNSASDYMAAVGGGGYNEANGFTATVPGGYKNTAGGDYSLAAGHRAKANHDGTFVWGDATDADFASTAANQFLIRASGGVGIGTTSPGEELDVAGTAQMTGFKMPTSAANGYVLTSDASGVGTWQAAAGGGWSLTGNAGTTPGTNFIGTTDNQAVEIKVNNTRILRLEPHATSPNMLGGYSGNALTAGVYGATIAGGGNAAGNNQVTDSYGTVAGGTDNQAGNNAGTVIDRTYATVSGGNYNFASGGYSVVGGGFNNVADGGASTVSGGGNNKARGLYSAIAGGGGDIDTDSNLALGSYSSIGGGRRNVASGSPSTVGGGYQNRAIGNYSTVPGGSNNFAEGMYSFAAGKDARASSDGTFVWADNSNFNFASTAAKQFSARCTGGARFVSGIDGSGNPNAGVQLAAGGTSWSAICDRNLKENFARVDAQGLLEKVASLPVMTWNAKAQGPSIRHIGPVAQDFYAAFNVGEDNTHITTTDADGVALAAIQALHQQNVEQKQEIQQLKDEIAELRTIVKELSAGKQ